MVVVVPSVGPTMRLVVDVVVVVSTGGCGKSCVVVVDVAGA